MIDWDYEQSRCWCPSEVRTTKQPSPPVDPLRQALRFLLAQWHEEARYPEQDLSSQSGVAYFTAAERRRVYHVCAAQLTEVLTLQGSAPQP